MSHSHIKCHSAFAHYNMFHSNHCHGGNNYGSVWNVTVNGGGTSFWGGFGTGLGYGIGNIFSGFFGGGNGVLGNAWGGSGNWLNGLWGGGNMYGGWNAGWFGNNSAKSDNDHCKCKKHDGAGGTGDTDDKKASNRRKSTIVNNGNKDTEIHRGFVDRKNAFEAKLLKGEIKDLKTNPDFKNLIADIKAKIETQADDVQNEHDIVNYKDLLKVVENLQKGEIEGVDQNVVKIKDGDLVIQLGDVKITTVDDLAKVPDDKINGLKAKTAQIILLNLGYIDKDAYSTKEGRPAVAGKTTDYLCCKMSNNYKVLLLMQKANVTVEFYKGASEKVDNWVTGTLSAVEKNEDGSVKSFEINCSETGAPGFQNTYTVTNENQTQYKIATKGTSTTIEAGTEIITKGAEKEATSGKLLIKKS